MIVSTIQSVVANLSKPVGFFFCDIYQLNNELDKYDLEQDIVYGYIPPFDISDTIAENDLIHTTFTLQFYLMRKLHHPTVDYKTIEVEPVIDEMRELAREFIHSLNSHEVVEKQGPAAGITSVKINSEYGFADAHLFGVSVQATVPIFENKTGCVS